VTRAAELRGLSDARIRQMCIAGEFQTAYKRGNERGWWFIDRNEVVKFDRD
jgi:hypothetical protein